MGHERFTPYATMIARHPERVIEKAVYGMLPKTALGRQVLRRKLRVYANADHPHVAQQPKPLSFSHAGEKQHGRYSNRPRDRPPKGSGVSGVREAGLRQKGRIRS